jgi:hypothetical protein
MKDTIDLRGASGAGYRFQLFREGRPLSPMGGNYLYVREEFAGGFTVLYSGEGENLLTGAASRWVEAENQHHATHLYTRLNISQAIRKSEHRDLIAGYNPLMNAEMINAPRNAAPAANTGAQQMGRQTVSSGPEGARDRPEA